MAISKGSVSTEGLEIKRFIGVGSVFVLAVNPDKKKLEEFKIKAVENLAIDGGGHLTYLAPTRVNLALMEERWPDVKFRATREHH
mgnify:CR=1 FL=1